MAWRPRLTDRLADVLRGCARGALLVNGIIFAFASIYVGIKFIWHLVRFLDRTIFSKPW